MNNPRPGVLAVRAINQYRRRDILVYLGLRYYLHNSSARSNDWIQRVATKLVDTRSGAPYFAAQHFKDCPCPGQLKHRPMFLPNANEALAETALLDECAKHPWVFGNPECVFSYKLASGADRSGVFEYYSKGLCSRHDAIALACDLNPSGVVRYQDIKRFYPSITAELALRTWKKYSSRAKLSSSYISLGERIIQDHGVVSRPDEKGILTGPMFSHLLANLVLREFDEEFCAKLPGQYFRYVDDIALVGNAEVVSNSLAEMRLRLTDLGFELHDSNSPKCLEVSTATWLEGRLDYRDGKRDVTWMSLIGDLKRLLLIAPLERENVQNLFVKNGFRIPVYDYQTTVYEAGYLERVYKLAKKFWFRRKTNKISADSLIVQALKLRDVYEREILEILAIQQPTVFMRKRIIPKLRYRAGRLIYLAAPETLLKLAKLLEVYSELHMHSTIMAAVATGNLDNILPLGTNAAQAAAQPIRAAGTLCNTSLSDGDPIVDQSLAIFALNGVKVAYDASGEASDLLKFATVGTSVELMKCPDQFTREIACLHGLHEHPRHAKMLETVFDEDEHLAIDAVDQLQNSESL